MKTELRRRFAWRLLPLIKQHGRAAELASLSSPIQSAATLHGNEYLNKTLELSCDGTNTGGSSTLAMI
jgi:hypothetical protein